MTNNYISTQIQPLFKYVSVCMILILAFTACSKTLKEEPKTLAVETFYNTATEVEAATNAIYIPLRNNAVGTYFAVLEAHNDYALGRGSYTVLNNFEGLDNVNVSRAAAAWESFYLSIRNANLVIKNAPNGKSISPADATKYVAEAKFLRALNYFHLVRNWAGVPIRTEANMTAIEAKRNTVDEVYKQIVADLKDAELNLPEQVSQIGRPTKWAAKTLLADAYLELKDFVQARDLADQVIKSNRYSLVPVTSADDYQKIYGPDIINTPEEIFHLKYSHQTGQGNLFPFLTNHPGTKFLGGGGGVYGHYTETTNAVYKNWDEGDFRKKLWYSWNIGLGTTSLLNKKYIDPGALAFGGASNDFPLYGYADVLLIYAEAAAKAENGPSVRAMEMLNQVHRRAYGKNPAAPSTVDFPLSGFASLDAFVDLVIKERGYEFQYEGKRWLELKRTGKAAAIILATKGKIIKEKHFLFPIPVSELNYNKAINPVADQNPGY